MERKIKKPALSIADSARETAIGDTKKWAKAGVMMRESYDIREQTGIEGVLPGFFSAEPVFYHQHSLIQKRHIHIQEETITVKSVSEKFIWG
jgi:hypothetical protein